MNLERFKLKPFYLKDEDLEWVRKTYESLTLDEKIGQIFFLTAYRDDEPFYYDLLKNSKFGGLMFRPMDGEKIVKGVEIIQKNSKIPVLISANLEQGANGFGTECTKIGSQMMVAATHDVKYGYELAKVSFKEASNMGLNFTFSPVTDIDMNWRNPITNTRTYGSDPDLVLGMCQSYLKACDEYGIATSVKHFPGDGVDERDQHLVTTVNSLSTEEWDKTYGRNYKAYIDAGTKAVMVGHICLPSYEKYFNPDVKDEEIMPATLSPILLKNLLRGRLGFNGLVISDATTMAGMNMAMSRDVLVPYAIESGIDMFLFTKNEEEDFRFMKEGYEKGILSHERMEEAVYTILAFKASLGLHKKNNIPPYRKINKEENERIAYEVADKSITLVKEQKGVLPLNPSKYRKILLHIIDSGENALGYERSSNAQFAELLRKEGFDVDIYDPGTNRYEGMLKPYYDTAGKYDLIIYIAAIATKSNQTTVRIEWINPMGMNVPVYTMDCPTIFISTENPYHMIDVPRIPTFINTYGKNAYTLECLIEKLMGRSEFKGVSPVDPYCGMWQTHLGFYDWRKK